MAPAGSALGSGGAPCHRRPGAASQLPPPLADSRLADSSHRHRPTTGPKRYYIGAAARGRWPHGAGTRELTELRAARSHAGRDLGGGGEGGWGGLGVRPATAPHTQGAHGGQRSDAMPRSDVRDIERGSAGGARSRSGGMPASQGAPCRRWVRTWGMGRLPGAACAPVLSTAPHARAHACRRAKGGQGGWRATGTAVAGEGAAPASTQNMGAPARGGARAR